MKQTTRDASGGTDATPQAPGGSTEASTARMPTPLHPSEHPLPTYGEAIDRDALVPTSRESDDDTLLTDAPTGPRMLEDPLNENVVASPKGYSFREWVEPLVVGSGNPGPHSPRISIPNYSFTQQLFNAEDAAQPGSKRVELRASPGFIHKLDSLSQETTLSRSDVIRKAVELYERALLEKSQGRVIGIAALEDNQIKIKEILQV
jgi:hypothetical protein